MKGPLTLEKYLAFPHLLVSAAGDFSGVVDAALTQLGKERRVIFSTSHFLTIPSILLRVPAIATLPEHSARRFAAEFDLTTSAPPVRLEGYTSSLCWLAKHEADPLHRWLREFVAKTVKQTLSPRP